MELNFGKLYAKLVKLAIFLLNLNRLIIHFLNKIFLRLNNFSNRIFTFKHDYLS